MCSFVRWHGHAQEAKPLPANISTIGFCNTLGGPLTSRYLHIIHSPHFTLQQNRRLVHHVDGKAFRHKFCSKEAKFALAASRVCLKCCAFLAQLGTIDASIGLAFGAHGSNHLDKSDKTDFDVERVGSFEEIIPSGWSGGCNWASKNGISGPPCSNCTSMRYTFE